MVSARLRRRHRQLVGAVRVALVALAALAGQRVPWGWLAVLIGLAGVFAPRGGYVVIGAVLMARKRSSVTTQRTQVDPASGDQVTRRESVASDPVE